MKTKFLIAISALVLVAINVAGDVTSADGVMVTSIVRLFAHPEKYQGKRVQILGYYASGFEHSGIFMTKEAAEINDIESAIWLDLPDDQRNDKTVQRTRNAYVTVVGTFHYDRKSGSGHLGAWPGSIDSITLFVTAKRTPLSDDPK